MNNDKQNKKYWTANRIMPLSGIPLAILPFDPTLAFLLIVFHNNSTVAE